MLTEPAEVSVSRRYRAMRWVPIHRITSYYDNNSLLRSHGTSLAFVNDSWFVNHTCDVLQDAPPHSSALIPGAT